MSRVRVAMLIGLSAAVLQPAAVRADVLEVDAGGARWVAGPDATPDTVSDEAPAEAPAVPDLAMADPAVNAAIVPQAYAAKIQELAARYDLSPALLEALVWQESRWRAEARSPAGARGLTQLMPETARDLGVNADDPMANLEGGARYLRQMLDHFLGDVPEALAAYNAGPGRVEAAGGIPRIRETQSYVTAVMGRLSDHARR